ncbi:MAG TPA: sulfatase-like hydrolase/transferase, partial [Roseiflexaceae bacterium]|nr:sulfatase-like hydrolase/transferase [Roseiflexaceae bacterium]
RSATSRQQPNIIVVFIDDAGYADYSSYGNTRVKTENIDRMAAEGLRFTQFYVNSPICSPSRTALVTGQYPARWRITSYIDNRALNAKRGMAQFLDPQAPMLARFLKEAGYRTGHFGKWHLGGGRDVGEAPLPAAYGFDASLTQFEGLGDRVLPIFDAHDGSPARKAPLGVASEKLGQGQITWMDRCQMTRAFVDGALSFIKKAEDESRPFYVNLWPDDVHSPFFPPAGTRGDGSKHALFDAVLKHMDEQLGPLFDYVRSNPKLRDNTLILITNDNGPEPGAGSAGVFRNGKGTLYEGGVREPLIVWGPGFVPASKRGQWDKTTVLSSVDLVPSLLKLARVAPTASTKFDGKFDGVDVSGALLGKPLGARAKPLFWKRPPDRPGPPEARWPDLAVRDREWKLLLNEDSSGVELYHVLRDPAESNNLAAQHPEIVRRLGEAVRAWNSTLPH